MYALVHPMAKHLGNCRVRLKVLLELAPPVPPPETLLAGDLWQVVGSFAASAPAPMLAVAEPAAAEEQADVAAMQNIPGDAAHMSQVSSRGGVTAAATQGADAPPLAEAEQSAAGHAVDLSEQPTAQRSQRSVAQQESWELVSEPSHTKPSHRTARLDAEQSGPAWLQQPAAGA